LRLTHTARTLAPVVPLSHANYHKSTRFAENLLMTASGSD
jgi:hypothetical protein